MKIGLFLQNYLVMDEDEFYRDMELVSKSDIDLLVFPECCYSPYGDIINGGSVHGEEINQYIDEVEKLSSYLGKAVIISDRIEDEIIFSLYVNNVAGRGETKTKLYIKHVMTKYSAFDLENYEDWIDELFEPVILKGKRIGQLICYDSNFPVFPRMYGKKGVDILINSTGGNVIYDKWYKYNKVRAIENNCYNFVTMGYYGDEDDKKNSYVFGFNPNGCYMEFDNLHFKGTEYINKVGSVYIFDTDRDKGESEEDTSLGQKEKESKHQDLQVDVRDTYHIIDKAQCLKENLYCLNVVDSNLIIILVNGPDILKPEKFVDLLYAEELRDLDKKRYLIINKWESDIDTRFYEDQLSSVLKVRAMENYCAVIVNSDNINKCIQSGKTKTAQVVKGVDGKYGLDLGRMTGAEATWRNKNGKMMRAKWRKGYELLIDKLCE